MTGLSKGDVFSFPYTRWHMVKPALPGSSALHARVLLLMPLNPRKGVKTCYAGKDDATLASPASA